MLQENKEKQKMIKVSEKISKNPQKLSKIAKNQEKETEVPKKLEKIEKTEEIKKKIAPSPEKNLNLSNPIGQNTVPQNAAYHRKKTDLTLYANATFSGGVFLNSIPGQSV